MMKRKIESSVIKVFWSVFGYSFVGFISLAYGIILQIHNYEESFKRLFSNDTIFKQFYFVLIIVIALLNLLFSHAYATLFADKKVQEKIMYPILGHWLEIILVIVVLTYLIPIVLMCENSIYVLLIVIASSLHWIICITFYRSFLKVQKERDEKPETKENKSYVYECVKYKLFVPAALMIASNIYMGSCIGEIWSGELVYFGLLFILDVFILGYTIFDFLRYRFCAEDIKIRQEKKENSIQKQEIVPIVLFYICLMIVAAVNVYVAEFDEKMLFDIPVRSMFLACFVASYLAMFEGWFILWKNVSPCNVAIKKGINFILMYMPIVVCAFFPFQDFQLMYFVFFCIGHNYARWYWMNYQKKQGKKYQNLAIMRAILGTTTLIALIIDKKMPVDVEDVIANIVNVETISNAGVILAAIEIAICIFSNKEISWTNMNATIIGYLITVIFLMLILFVGKNASEERIFLSIIAMLVFIVFECYIFSKNSEEVGEEASETE